MEHQAPNDKETHMDIEKEDADEARRAQMVKLLTGAEGLIAEARRLLDVQGVTCTHCNVKRHVNWTEAQAHEQLGGALTKVHRWKERLGKSTTAFDAGAI